MEQKIISQTRASNKGKIDKFNDIKIKKFN